MAERRLERLSLEELATYRNTECGFPLAKWLQSCFSEPELEHAYCAGCVQRMRYLLLFYCSICLTLDLSLFLPLRYAHFYEPHVDGVVVDSGPWQTIAQLTKVSSTIVLSLFASLAKGRSFREYERLCVVIITISVFILPLTQQWRAVALHRWLTGCSKIRPDICRNPECTKHVGDIVLCLALAFAQLSIILLPRARWSWAVGMAANLGYMLFTIPFGGSPAEGQPNDGSYLLTIPCIGILFAVGSCAWFAQLALEISLRQGWLQYHQLAALHAERERLERDFAATAYHELRNPLSGTVGYLRISHDALVSLQQASAEATGTTESARSLAHRHEATHRALHEYVSSALVCCESTLVNLRSLTSLYKLEATSELKLTPKPTKLRQLLRETCVVSVPLLSGGTKILLNLPSPDEFHAAGLGDDGHVNLDAASLSQILTNLMHNSARFTTDQSAFVCLSCRIVPQQNDDARIAAARSRAGALPTSAASPTDPSTAQLVEFEVLDTGVGVSQEMQAQLASGMRYSSIGGIGLGMVLCKALVRSFVTEHGGEELELASPVCVKRQDAARACGVPIGLTAMQQRYPTGDASAQEDAPRAGVGTSVRFALLLEPVHAAAAVWVKEEQNASKLVHKALRALPSTASSELPRGISVLVADDQDMNRRMLRLILEKKLGKGWNVTECATATGMLQLLGVEQSGAGAPITDCTNPPSRSFDLLITDDQFSYDPTELKGSEAVRILRASGRSSLPVIVCSGGDEGNLTDSGADRVWGKPMPSWSDGSMQRELAHVLGQKAKSD